MVSADWPTSSSQILKSALVHYVALFRHYYWWWTVLWRFPNVSHPGVRPQRCSQTCRKEIEGVAYEVNCTLITIKDGADVDIGEITLLHSLLKHSGNVTRGESILWGTRRGSGRRCKASQQRRTLLQIAADILRQEIISDIPEGSSFSACSVLMILTSFVIGLHESGEDQVAGGAACRIREKSISLC